MAEEFQKIIDQFVVEVEGLRVSIGPLMKSTEINGKMEEFILGKFLGEYGTLVNETDGEKSYRIQPAQFGQLRRLDRKVKGAAVAQSLLPGSLLVTLVSRYDAFLGRLVRTMLLVRPELQKSSERSLSFALLVELGDFEAAKHYLMEKEIESVLRGSHEDHFEWLEKRLDITLRKGLPSWAKFIEITERRNLLVHSDGIVSHQYLTKCKANGDCSLGDKLEVPHAYFKGACDCLLEIGVKLTHVIWRKLLPDDRSNADEALNSTCFELLLHDNHRLANELLYFATEVLKTFASEQSRLTFVINRAQALKWLGNDEECVKLLDQFDWTAKLPQFQLCVAVLKEEYEAAVVIMKQMGKDGPVTDENYLMWPVFRKARKNELFQRSFQEIFGREMEMAESVVPIEKGDIEEFFESLGKHPKEEERELSEDAGVDNID